MTAPKRFFLDVGSDYYVAHMLQETDNTKINVIFWDSSPYQLLFRVKTALI